MNPVIEYILKKHKITDYLTKLGHQPVKSLSRGRLTYLCPFPDHKEMKPSFYVWTHADPQNFCCFGCGRYYSIIHLMAGMEHLSTKQVIMRLSDGLEMTEEGNLDIIIDSLNSAYNKKPDENTGRIELENTVYSISSMCLSYLEGVKYKDTELDIIDKLYQEVDQYIYNYDIAQLEEMLHYLPDLLIKRREKIELAASN